VLIAEQVGTLAAIARGRFIFQCGLGDGEAQFLAMGANIKQRPSAFEEAFDIIKRLLAGETVSSQGRFVLENARVSPRPAEPVEYWIGASARVSIDRAARIADGWLASPSLTLNRAREQADWYRDACAKYGKTPAAVAIRRDIYVGESSAEAEAVGRAVVKAGYRGFDPAASCGARSRRSSRSSAPSSPSATPTSSCGTSSTTRQRSSALWAASLRWARPSGSRSPCVARRSVRVK